MQPDSEDSDSDAELTASSDDEQAQVLTTPSKKRKNRSPDDDHVGPIIVQAAFDAYFTHAAARPQTSTSVFSAIIPPLSSQEYAEATKDMSDKKMQSILLTDNKVRNTLFTQILRQVNEGFNVLCYGYGSKRSILNQFAVQRCSKHGHVVVVNGFQASFNIKDMFTSLESLPGYKDETSSGSSIERQSKAVAEFFSESQQRHLYLIIHNIDAPSLRTPKVKACLETLAAAAHIHIIASVDHVSAPLIWSSRERFSWLWHDLTTLAPYDVELAHADRSSISGAQPTSRKQRADGPQAAANISETAASHILASVNQNALKLFALMARKQLEAVEDAGASASNDMQPYAIEYEMLFKLTREQFIATTDTSLRQLLGEFRDHSLIVSAQGSSGPEKLWIPLRKERLTNVLNGLPSTT
ncbi:origin recognition complex subunit 2 [Hymenopellis radicata]|nr:origin recognition complex subunit 2 [Hymenopellis radicata]